MTAQEFESRIVDWAHRQPDIVALIQAGSRAGPVECVDKWSDWDFHLISTTPHRYHSTDWLVEIAPLWCATAAMTARGVIKVSAIYDHGMEVDFVPLSNWQMKFVYWAMQYPNLAKWMPQRLHMGIIETRAFLLGSGYRILIGGSKWEKRVSAVTLHWSTHTMSEPFFQETVAAFWQKVVWVTKKVARPELRSAIHWLHKLVLEQVYVMLAEEARLVGRAVRPEARKAEKWLSPRRLEQTAITTSLDQRVLARALLAEIALFEEVSLSVAQSRGFKMNDYSNVAGWLRTELGKLV